MLVRGRLDAVNGVDDATLVRWLETVGTDLVLVHHVLPQMEGTKWETGEPHPDTTNPHYHFYLNTTYKSAQSLAYQLKKTFNVAKTDWSIKPCDPTRRDEYWQYLFNEKHGNKVRLVKSFTDLEAHKLKAHAISEDFKGRHKGKPKAVTQWDLIIELVEMIKTMAIDPSKVTEISELCIKLHIKHKKAFCFYSIERIVVTALAHVDSYKVAEAVNRSICKRLVESFR